MHIYAMIVHMRTTLNLDDELHAALKRLAADEGRSLTEVLEDAIRGLLANVSAAAEQPVPTFPSFDGGDRPGTLPGVDVDDNAAMQDLLDEVG